MSDTESKKPSKGVEHVTSKKRSAVAALAAVEAVTAIDDVANNVVVAPAMSPHSRKMKKQDRKQQQQLLKQTTAVPVNTACKEEEEEGDEQEEEEVEQEEEGGVKGAPLPLIPAREVVEIANVQVKVEASGTVIAVPADEKVVLDAVGKVLTICPSVRKLVSNASMASSGPPDALTVTSRPETHVLAMITNDVEWVSKMNKEKESAFTNLNFVVLKVTTS